MLKFVVIFIALPQWLAIAQQNTEYSEICGRLNENYLYNLNSTAAVDEFPWIARVYYENKDRYSHDCQAVLISKRHLLIPAQCVTQTPTKYREPYAVILGADNQCYRTNSCPSPVPNYYEIDDIALHLNLTYNSNGFIILDNNIAIITLKSDVSFNAEVSPICLPSHVDSRAHSVGQYLQYAGYAKNLVLPLKTIAHVASLQKCRDLFKVQSLGNSYMCVVSRIKEQTWLGAGAPLMGVATTDSPAHPQNLYLIGLASFGSINYNRNAVDVVISIGPHIEWIKFNTNTA